MWEQFFGYLPERIIFICTILSFLIPYAIYKINVKLHEYGDPPWKREEKPEPPSSDKK